MQTIESRSATLKLLAFAVFAALAGLNGPALAQKAERPEVKVGDQWKFECGDRKKQDRVWVITAVDATGIKGTENGQALALTLDLNVLEAPRGKWSDARWLSFPLEVGKKWSTSNEWNSGGYEGSEKLSATVTGYEKVKVRAGEFDAFKLKLTTNWSVRGGGYGDNSAIYWYAPAARAIAKYDLRSSGTATETCELIELTLQP